MDWNKIKFGLILGIVLLSFWALNYFLIQPLIFSEKAFEVCGEKHYLRQCYGVDEDQCNTLWKSVKETCFHRHLEEARKERPGLLEGPVTQACREYEFDKFAKYMHTGSKDPACRGLSSRIRGYHPPRN